MSSQTTNSNISSSRATSAMSSPSSTKLNPAAQVFTPTKQNSYEGSPAAPKAEKTLKTIEEGDVGCFLCDDGLWCPFCSTDEDEDSKPEAKVPETPLKAKTSVETADFHRTPGHEREAGKTMVAGSQGAAQNMMHQQKEMGCSKVVCPQPRNWPTVKQRIDGWLISFDGSGGSQ